MINYMSTRKHFFVIGEYYHIYNRGVDKRDVILDLYDLQRLEESFIEFNTENPIGSIYENSFKKGSVELGSKASKLVDIIAYCFNPNHFHLLLTPLVENGVEKFMQRIGGYTKYFNNKYKRTGRLFEDKFKSKHVAENRYLIHVSAYINMNNRDELGSLASKLSKSSFEDYIEADNQKSICNIRIVLDQFKSKEDYKRYAIETRRDTLKRKDDLKDLEFEHLEARLPNGLP